MSWKVLKRSFHDINFHQSITSFGTQFYAVWVSSVGWAHLRWSVLWSTAFWSYMSHSLGQFGVKMFREWTERGSHLLVFVFSKTLMIDPCSLFYRSAPYPNVEKPSAADTGRDTKLSADSQKVVVHDQMAPPESATINTADSHTASCPEGSASPQGNTDRQVQAGSLAKPSAVQPRDWIHISIGSSD